MSSILLLHADPAAGNRSADILGRDSTFGVMAAVSTVAQARVEIQRRVPDLIISDLRLGDGLLTDLLDALRPDRSHVLAMVPNWRDPLLMHALRHGADAFLASTHHPEALLAAARQVLAGESPMAPEIARQLQDQVERLNARPVAPGARAAMRFSKSEQRLLVWTGEGYRVPDVARGLKSTPQQVSLMMRAIHRRFHLDTGRRPAGATGVK